MQRRAAAVYATLFVVLAAGALVTMAVADRPTVTVADPDRRVSVNDTLPLDGHPYTVDEVGAESAEFRWINDSERQTTTIDNGSTLSPADADWPGRAGRYEAIIPNWSTIRYDGRDLGVHIPDTTRPTSFTLRNASGAVTTTIEAGGSLRYRGNETTVATVTPDAVTLAWGDPAIVHVPNGSDPDVITLRQDPDVATILSWDPRVENETVTRADGRRYVVYRESNRTELFSTYYPTRETNLTEGSTFTYRGATATIEKASTDGVLFAWRGPVEHTRSVTEGETVILEGTKYVAHFPGDGTVALSTAIDAYREQVDVRAYYTERVNGLWGVVILSALAAVFLLGAAYLPSRY